MSHRHVICEHCWRGKFGERTAVVVDLDAGEDERCCFCGRATRSGIYTVENANPEICKITEVVVYDVAGDGAPRCCPTCNAPLDKATAHEKVTPMLTAPKPGDYSLCLNCGEWLCFDEQLVSRKAALPLNMHPAQRRQVLMLQNAIRARGRFA